MSAPCLLGQTIQFIRKSKRFMRCVIVSISCALLVCSQRSFSYEYNRHIILIYLPLGCNVFSLNFLLSRHSLISSLLKLAKPILA